MLTTALLVALSAPAAALQLTAFTSGADFLTHAGRCRVGLTAVDRDISLPKNVDKKTLKRRFKELAIELHPDVSGGDADAAAKFAQLSAEYHRRLSESRRGAQASAVGGVSAMTVFVASALYGTTQDPFMPIVLLGAAASLGSVFVNASGKGSGPPKQLAAEKRMLRHGTDPDKGIRIEAIAADAAVMGLSLFAAALNAAVDAAIAARKRKEGK